MVDNLLHLARSGVQIVVNNYDAAITNYRLRDMHIVQYNLIEVAAIHIYEASISKLIKLLMSC